MLTNNRTCKSGSFAGEESDIGAENGNAFWRPHFGSAIGRGRLGSTILMKLLGKTALVTGAARGLGRAYALRLAALGADVAVVDIHLDGAAEFGEQLSAASVPAEIERLGRRSLGVEADLTQRGEAHGAVHKAHEAFGRIDILVNNAGGALTPAERSRASESPEEDTRFLFDVNYMSAVHCCQAAAAIMKRQGSGIIVNISSQSGISTYQQGLLAGYAAAKAALTHYTRYLAAELGPFGIRANCLAPGIMMTARVAAQAAKRGVGTDEEAARIPLRRLGQVEDCAGVLEFLTTDLSQYVTGQVISVCGGAVLTPN
jgi:NAD(P)-dependent dehydrogenase (short-subunit alcohol dehydrogenase family)